MTPFHEFYSSSLRTGLFSGFLTLSGFLLAMKTLVVIQLRKELYDTDYYRKRVLAMRKLNASIKVYAPLKRFGRLLLAAIILSLLTAVAQFSLGLIAENWAAKLCLGLAALTLIVLLVSMVQLWLNLGDLFQHWDEEAEGKMEDLKKKAG